MSKQSEPSPSGGDPDLTLQEVARLAKVDLKQAQNIARANYLQRKKSGRSWHYPREEAKVLSFTVKRIEDGVQLNCNAMRKDIQAFRAGNWYETF